MLTWFLLALGSAFTNSWTQATQKLALKLTSYSKYSITFIASATASSLLFIVSYFFVGFPAVDSRFWLAIFITGVLNFISFPLMLKAYEVGEFSSVYSMILLTPVFLLITSFIFLGEAPSLFGILGVLLTIFGLWFISQRREESAVLDFKKGNFLGILVAFIFSITVNFDKIATQHSDVFFSPAIGSLVMAICCLFYLLFRYKRILVRNGNVVPPEKKLFGNVWILFLLGTIIALSSIFHNSALLAGFASYTIAIKRTGILFGVLWGWLFFDEKGIAKKLLGAGIAISGVIAILFS